MSATIQSRDMTCVCGSLYQFQFQGSEVPWCRVTHSQLVWGIPGLGWGVLRLVQGVLALVAPA